MQPATKGSLVATIVLCLAASGPSIAAGDVFAGRPAFSEAEQPVQRPAECSDVRRMGDGLPVLDYRIDLSAIGSLMAVQTDGVLWYLVLCSSPDIRIMCVTYESNGMAVGDRVIVKGGYRRLDANHVQLDPCLANRPEQ
ncbi:hypothetical protein [Bradyrhizobium sp. BWA-3-5]|uniref:hypothetical protein n=1 Tax=Bradyrhizobium sp. BWA-3-5 TaxID=3080013 RepID=UPI00293E03C9|nr:hypothetical protein [Bradyrhizobium sp. BWA-3-5]WOH63105.1 hypothetical protein RX331_20430 [Bradyrhizobium sp. BWA-3-5]